MNYKLYHELSGPQHGDIYLGWSVVALFYAALHYVEGVFVLLGKKCTTTHVKRDEALARDARFATVLPLYNYLKQQSLLARYECVQLSINQVHAAHSKYKSVIGLLHDMMENETKE